jgi:DNA-binding transcriptional regulator YiaG
MSNLAKLLKETIERAAKKQARAETNTLKKASMRHRKITSDLSSRVKDLERQVAQLQKRLPQSSPEEAAAGHVRFSPKMVQAMRKKLGLTAKRFGMLIGASTGTIGNWEHGKSRPRKSQMTALAGLRKMGKREAKRKLEKLAQR